MIIDTSSLLGAAHLSGGGSLPLSLLLSRVLLAAAAINKRPIYLGQFCWLTHPNYFASGMFILDHFTLGVFMLQSILLQDGKKRRGIERDKGREKKKRGVGGVLPLSCMSVSAPIFGPLSTCVKLGLCSIIPPPPTGWNILRSPSVRGCSHKN